MYANKRSDSNITGVSETFLINWRVTQVIHGVMKLVYFLSRQKRCLAASLIIFSTQHVTMRLVWVLTHYKQVGSQRSSLSLRSQRTNRERDGLCF